eukprot:6369018-Amphidinium_carterae.1
MALAVPALAMPLQASQLPCPLSGPICMRSCRLLTFSSVLAARIDRSNFGNTSSKAGACNHRGVEGLSFTTKVLGIGLWK